MLYILDVEADFKGVDIGGGLLAGVPVLSPLVYNVAYRYPVHDLDPGDPPVAPPETPTHLIVYRDLADEMRFFKVNVVTARLLERLAEQPELTGRAQLEAIATEMGHPEPEAVIAGGAQTLATSRRAIFCWVCAAPDLDSGPRVRTVTNESVLGLTPNSRNIGMVFQRYSWRIPRL